MTFSEMSNSFISWFQDQAHNFCIIKLWKEFSNNWLAIFYGNFGLLISSWL